MEQRTNSDAPVLKRDTTEDELWFADFLKTNPTFLDVEPFYKNQQSKKNEDMGIPFDILEKFMCSLCTNTTLEDLRLRFCNVADTGLQLLGKALQKNTTLRSIDLSNNNITAKALLEFAKEIQNNYSLTSCILHEEAKDLHSKNATRHESFNLDTVDSLVSGVKESTLFQDAFEELKVTILIPNRDNLPCMRGTGGVLNLKYREYIPKNSIQTMLHTCMNNLTVLVLEACQLGELPPDLEELVFLEQLWIARNGLNYLPEEIGALRELKILHFDGNYIKKFPDSIALLVEMEEISAEDNQLTEIPVTLIRLQKLQRLVITKNPIERPYIPNKFFEAEKDERKKGSAILQYLQEIYSSELRVVNRCKLMFVGDGGVGKSSLVKSFITWTTDKKRVKRLIKRKVDVLPSEEINVATDGIEVTSIFVETFGKKIKYSKGDQKKIEFSLWDFAGQEVYYSTHQFFLNDRSIYIVCCNLEEKDDVNAISRIEYWLQSLAARAPKAPVIIVCSHWLDSKPASSKAFKEFKEFVDRKFKPRFKTLIEVYPVSNDTLKGVEEILHGLIKIALSGRYKKRLGIEEERPVSWLALEEKAKALITTVVVPIIPWPKWVKVAQQSCDIATEDMVRVATEFLHDLGAVVWFDTPESGLSDTVILDSEWLTKVFSSVVSAKNCAEHGMSGTVKAGILQHKDLDLIWRPPFYPPGLHPFLLAVLEKFEVLHRLEGNAVNNTIMDPNELLSDNNVLYDFKENREIKSQLSSINEGRSLIPCLLTDKRPAVDVLLKIWPENPASLSTQLGRFYEFEFLPNGFFSRLMVRLLHSNWEAKEFWKYGIILYKSESMLRLELEHIQHKLILMVRGPNGANKMGRLIESIDTLISDWLSVEVKISVPCISCYVRGEDTPYHFPLQECEKAVSKGDSSVNCPLCEKKDSKYNKTRLDLLVPDLTMAGALSPEKKIEYKTIKIGKEIGRGGFAVVYKGEYNGNDVAVKQLLFDEKAVDIENNTFTEHFAEFRREVWLMSNLGHPNIIELVGICTHPLCMVLEFATDGNLYEWTRKKGPPNTSQLKERENFALDISQGCLFLHQLNPPVIHRDLKSPNILLSHDREKSRLVCKIADFGLSRGLVWNTDLEGKVVDNPIWLAPEILRHQRYTEKVDIYAFGVILWELMSGADFFGDTDFMSAIEDKIKKGERPVIPSHTPSYYKKLIEICWDDDQNARPSFAQTTESIVTKSSDVRAAPSRIVVDDYTDNERAVTEKHEKEKQKDASLRIQIEQDRAEKDRVHKKREEELDRARRKISVIKKEEAARLAKDAMSVVTGTQENGHSKNGGGFIPMTRTESSPNVKKGSMSKESGEKTRSPHSTKSPTQTRHESTPTKKT